MEPDDVKAMREAANALGWFGSPAVRERSLLETHARDSLENLLFAVCEESPKMFVHLCGLGSAAGLLTERGLFGEFQQQVEAQQGSDAARIEEMDVN